MSRRRSTSMTAVAWLLINDSQDPTLGNCVFSAVVWYSATNKNNGPSVSRLHWNSFLSPSFHQHKNLLGETGYFRSTQKMKENESCWIQMGARNTWTSSMSFYQHIYKNNNNKKKTLNRGVFHLEQNTIEQRGQVREYNSNRNGLGPKRGREQLFWPFEHLRRWQTAESALSPVVASHTSSSHSGFLH